MAIHQLLPGLQLARCPSVTYLAIKGPKTSDKGQIPTFSITFPSTSFQEVDVTLLGGGVVIVIDPLKRGL